MRPQIICHMMTSVDGKITDSYMRTKSAEIVAEEYERTNNYYNPDAWLCGRVTTDENFTFYHKPDLDDDAVVSEGDYVAENDVLMYFISVDPLGRIGWALTI